MPSPSRRRASQEAFVFSTSPETISFPIVTIAATAISRVCRVMEIRPLEDADAPAVVALELELRPEQVFTVPGLLHDIHRAPVRERRRDWVALERGTLVGQAVAGFNW